MAIVGGSIIGGGGGGGGDVKKSGSPVNTQLTNWIDNETIQGITNVVFDGSILTIGHTVSVAARLGQTLETNVSDDYGGAAFATWSNTTTDCSFFELCKSASNTIGTHSIVADNELLGYVQFRGSDGSQFRTGALIAAVVDGTPSGGSVPAELLFYTNSSVVNFQIAADGSIFMQNLSTLSGQADVQYNTSTKELGYVTSSERYKTNIRNEEEKEIDTTWLHEINFKTYDRLDGTRIDEVSPLAEEIAVKKPDMCAYNEKGEVETYSNSGMVPYLWKEIQNLRKEIDLLKASK